MVVVEEVDRRVQMWALVMGAINDQRTKISLVTRANISVISEALVRRL